LTGYFQYLNLLNSCRGGGIYEYFTGDGILMAPNFLTCFFSGWICGMVFLMVAALAMRWWRLKNAD
jgi:hypothetical protein